MNMNARVQTVALITGMALLPSILLADDHSDWHDWMQPIVPHGYLCHHTATPIVVNLPESTWP